MLMYYLCDNCFRQFPSTSKGLRQVEEHKFCGEKCKIKWLKDNKK